MTTKKAVLGYHGNCFDGFGSYYYVRKFFENSQENYSIDCKSLVYGPSIQNDSYWESFCDNGSLVIFADFCPERKYINILLNKLCTVLILDHHVTALKYVDGIVDWEESVDNFKKLEEVHDRNVRLGMSAAYKVFDMERSGVGITYDFFYAGKPRTRLANYLEDRDLWKFQWHRSREINAYIQSQLFMYEIYQPLEHQLELDYTGIAEVGEGLLRATEKTVDTITKDKLKIVPVFDGINTYRVAFFNSTSHWSEVGNTVLDQNPDVQISCSVCFDFVKHTVMFSFRSRAGSAVDCSVIATKLGGGGHKPAAGAVQLIGNAMGWLTSLGVV